MKPLSLSQIQRTSARHDARAPRQARVFPRTDFHFQVQAEEVVAPARTTRPAATRDELRDFRHMTSDYLAKGTLRNRLLELTVGAVVVGLVAWSLASLLILLAQTAGG
ncbi:MAG TPA: hypothetical protein VHW03_00110 [Chthoniobacterales bacterium]|jgi:hypothetical protein|nr:hypothetical protein [Chthoniobacterales bacterium]